MPDSDDAMLRKTAWAGSKSLGLDSIISSVLYTPTNVSNIFAWGYFLVAAIRLAASKGDEAEVFAPQAKYTALISLLITALIAHFMLFDAMFKDGQPVWHLVAMHYVVPAMALLDWLLFDEKGKMVAWGPFAWLSLAAAYLIVVMVGAGRTDARIIVECGGHSTTLISATLTSAMPHSV